MQNTTKRSASDIRIHNFKSIISKNRIVEDEVMRKFLGCSVATYRREMPFYLQSCNGVVHEARMQVIGYEKDIDEQLAKQQRWERKG